jgi:hypothetical protein
LGTSAHERNSTPVTEVIRGPSQFRAVGSGFPGRWR